jgi:antitoxin (DNA-binding transcriptional repressor) of toxin-antitoxin stability system
MPTVNIYAAKTQLSKLVDLAASGTDVVIARAGKPMVKLTALTNKDRRTYTLGILEGKGWIADDFDAPLPDEILAQFEGRSLEGPAADSPAPAGSQTDSRER